MEEDYVNLKGSGHVLHFYKSLKWLSFCGPVAQLGALHLESKLAKIWTPARHCECDGPFPWLTQRGKMVYLCALRFNPPQAISDE